MTDPDFTALARRLVACQRFRWLPGMLTTWRQRIISIQPMGDAHGDWIDIVERHQIRGLRVKDFDSVPDLRDAATLGCLLQLLREAEFEGVSTLMENEAPHRWLVVDDNGSMYGGGGDSEAEALVAALLAVPE